MVRSSGNPRSTGISGLTRIIRSRTSSVTVKRPTETKDSLDATTETTSDHSESIWLYEPRESVANEMLGERVEGSLGGLAIADGTVDIEKGDRVTYGGVEYEVDTIVGHPEDGQPGSSANTDFWIMSFVRRQ